MAGAVFSDLYKDRIYNFWIVPGLLAGVISSAAGGLSGLKNSILAVLLAFAVLLPVYLVKGIAAGDVKLIMSTASFLSFQELYSCILFSFLIAGAISLFVIIFRKKQQRTVHFALPVALSTLFAVGGFL